MCRTYEESWEKKWYAYKNLRANTKSESADCVYGSLQKLIMIILGDGGWLGYFFRFIIYVIESTLFLCVTVHVCWRTNTKEGKKNTLLVVDRRNMYTKK